MKPIVQRRRSTPSAITKALGKSKNHSRETTLSSSHSDNGLPSGVFSSPGSTFILDERVQLTMGLQTQERHLILFSDVLVIAKSKSSSSLKLKKQVPLSEVWTGTCLSEVTEKKMGPENSFVIGWPTTNYVVTFSSADVKERWLSALLWHINEVKQNEYLKNLTLQIFVLDADNCSSTTAVNVSNVETAESVMKKTLLQLGLPGRTSEHHLWVISGKDDPAYPLIGHEHPFSIALNCLRDSADQQQGTNNNTLLADGTESSFLDQLPKEKQCQFVLKPRLQAPVQLRRESLQKHTKRKKSLIDWALRRSTSTPTGSPPSQSPTTPRKLFGLSLSSVCPDGILPKPIMDMLLLLYHEGPSTRGIFRRSANAKTCKELKEKLNSGDDVQVDGESVFVAAAVITDFLRNIPDSVLSSDMHGLWMEAVDTENRTHKIEAIKSLVNQLPEANLILLRHLFGVLHHIEQNSGVNQMNAFNLALCIAPNMLWLPSPTGPEEESRSTKKVALLVQFLIENSGEIFGGDIASLFQRPDKKKSKNSDESLGIGLAQHDDSSDELEFSACDPEGPKHHLVPETDAIFEASSSLLLDEDQEDWDLFSEITACYQSKARKNTSADSYDLLEEEGSFCSIGSIRSLSPARDRCSSEPSVCLSSQLPAQSHEPVARQSSCDATIMHSHTDYIHRLKQLQVESQKLIDEGLSPGVSKARQNLWQSPQTSSRVKQLSLQKSSLSNRSSFSSLSSTTTSPSASSLSSLDSAFSYCSESSAISPTDVSSLPFMFGTSARLHAVSPKIAKRSLKEWHKSLTSPVPLHLCDLDSFHEYERKAVESSHCFAESKSFPSVSGAAVGSPLTDTDWEEEERQLSGVAGPGPGLGSWDYTKEFEQKPELPAASPASEKSPQISHQQHREKAVKNIEIKSIDACPPSQESLKRTKITFYMAPNKESSWGSPVEEEEERPMANTSSSDSPSSSSEQSLSKSLQTVRVHIPQTVFYGQNTPLVLQSISRRYHHEPMIPSPQAEHKESPQSASTPEELESKPVEMAQAPTQSKGFNTFSHTIRIILPASIRNTVREYFKHDETKTCPTAEAEAVENELLRSRVEWLRSQPLAEVATEERDTVVFAEETFV
ncbi:rho GTPase-activating protein 20-like [Aquila chrysaetos chrysaetos]|uniref:Rho GTPase-activating protein 20-like n=1 Tax=Aquila chrysaetos chrysaetos TaxID=223781 RepID=A0A663EVG8_AQUCH|nr:rho GTPase-activating protein 20-like [Aquila chrysaetos chrysaetos]XP_029853035.1 rho GTPase-activating protein 20-like [Aquila chrysaetos chrysaetos]XP_040975060.1 rho GTPase-activating protein 20-like [Aquila chrysaetos chrysaetos]XP_040975061.1 rho GTPase-activating protein 20-like [Aquila chrysaetos chrysaetos]